MEVVYGILDSEGLMITSVVVVKDDFETLEEIKKMYGADSYREIDPEVYIIRPGTTYWNGTNWDKKPAQE